MKSKNITLVLLAASLLLSLLISPVTSQAQQDHSSDELIGQWEVVKVTTTDGTIIKEQPEGMRDQIEFMENYTVAIIKGDEKGLGMWKFYQNRITVADKASEQTINFEVVSITDEKMELRTTDGKGGKVIVHYRRL